MHANDVPAAAERIRAYIHRTPVLTSRLLNHETGVQVYLKCENLQRGGAFKARGAFNFLLQMTPEERTRGVVAFSSGNHAQAVALAARDLRVPASIVMPDDAPTSKVEATRSYGARIHFYDRQTGDRESIAASIAERTGATLVPPFDHERIVAGQGTTALELLQEVPDVNTVVTPLGGGGLLSGTILIAKAMSPHIRVYGVEPETANDWQQSLERSQRVTINPPCTIADGLRTLAPGCVPWEIVLANGDGVVTVSDDEIKAAVRFLLARLKVLVEPSGAAGVAALLNRRILGIAGKVGVILSGGNIDFATLATICSEEAQEQACAPPHNARRPAIGGVESPARLRARSEGDPLV